MDIFTAEERNLMCIYDTRSKEALLSSIKESIPHIYEPEMQGIIETIIKKLKHISDSDFLDIYFVPDEMFNE